MRVLLVGSFHFGSTNVWQLTALRRLGCTVVTHPYREIPVQEQHARGQPFDVVWVNKGVPLKAADFAHLATLGTHRVLYFMDPFENWNDELSAAVRSGAWQVAATSCVVLRKIANAVKPNTIDPCLDSELGKPEGGHHVFDGVRFARILEGADCEGPWPTPSEIRPALLHFGHLSDRRKAIIETLRSAGIEVNHLSTPLYGARLQKEVLRHAAVLGINSSPDLYSNRVQTVLAMGSCILQEIPANEATGPIWTDFMHPGGGPLYLFEDAGDAVVEAARSIIRDAAARRDPEFAARVFARYSWTKCMERALAFAVPNE